MAPFGSRSASQIGISSWPLSNRRFEKPWIGAAGWARWLSFAQDNHSRAPRAWKAQNLQFWEESKVKNASKKRSVEGMLGTTEQWLI